eukprot:CAMPEP_0201495536 /NCGR_PEP_ID=MMETSP0151_2-20130828/54486_1 /ASSEMBLY_ACC=CAM_ASM_000257 /TAXON_ID=200890 /ORGANISM="Paramoeba atlantica, Strain 621/1 / CCAP 1560/9" /LENGTH=37 /DNA_ID= /DNA_START= /DNA_END= /DNA_ORIENTATION=
MNASHLEEVEMEEEGEELGKNDVVDCKFGVGSERGGV